MKTPASQLGPYEIQSEIGRGGMGVVFLATDTRLDRQVAIAYLRGSGIDRAKLLEGATDDQARAIYNSLPLDTMPTDIGNISTMKAPSANARALGLLDPVAVSVRSVIVSSRLSLSAGTSI